MFIRTNIPKQAVHKAYHGFNLLFGIFEDY